MSIDQRKRAPARPPLPDGRPETWVYLADCEMPEDGKQVVAMELKAHPCRGKERVWLEEGIKLWYLFSRLWAATKRTKRGLTVLRAEETLEGLGAWYQALSPEESSGVSFHYLHDPYEEPVMRIG